MQILLSATDILRSIGASICKLIYWLIANLYELFLNVSSVQFLQESNLRPIYQRITLMLSIIMIFYVTFQTVKYIIQPDTITDKEQGTSKVVQKMIIVVVLIAMVPQIFSMAYTLQNSILRNQLFSKVILGKESVNVATYGRSFSANLFSLFYYVDEEYWKDEYPDIKDLKCEDTSAPCKLLVDTNISTLASTGHLTYLDVGLNSEADHPDESGEDQTVYAIKFDGWLAVAVGLFVCYMLLLYCIDAGTRVAQLAFLQIIAPIPIIGYLSPKKDGIFEKWLKQCTTTYLDLFLRMGVIYIVLLLTEILGNAYHNNTLLSGLGGVSSEMKFFIYIALVVGLLAFAKRAPKMLQELFPKMGAASGSLGLSLKDRTEGITSLAKGANNIRKGAAKYVGYGRQAIGGAAGFTAGLVAGRGRIGAAVAGAKEGFDKKHKGLAGGSVINRARKAAAAGGRVRQNRKDIRANGGTPFGAEHRQEHYKNIAQEQDRKVSQLENMQNKKKAVAEAVDGLKFRKQMETMGEAIDKADPAAGKAWGGVKKNAERLARQYANGRISEADFKNGVNTLINNFNNENRTRALERATEDYNKDKADFIANGGEEKDFNKKIDDYFDNNSVVRAANIDDADFEIGSSNWGTVKTTLEEAKKVAKIIKENGYTWTDKDGVAHAIVNNEETIAEDIGTFTDNANTAVSQEKSTSEYKRAHTNAKGPGNGGNS